MRVLNKLILFILIILNTIFCQNLYAKTTKKTLENDYLRSIFKGFICKQIGSTEDDVLVSKFRVYGERSIPPGEFEYRIFRKSRGPLSGLVRLVMIVKVDGVPRTRLQMAGWVDVFRPVVCAKRSIKKGQIITKDDLYMERRNLSHLSDKVVDDFDYVVGMMAKHNIKENTPIKKWMVERAPIVKRGDIVTILAEKGALRVTVPGRVLEQGYSGDIVRVQNIMSRKQIFARILNNKTVLVEF